MQYGVPFVSKLRNQGRVHFTATNVIYGDDFHSNIRFDSDELNREQQHIFSPYINNS